MHLNSVFACDNCNGDTDLMLLLLLEELLATCMCYPCSIMGGSLKLLHRIFCYQYQFKDG